MGAEGRVRERAKWVWVSDDGRNNSHFEILRGVIEDGTRMFLNSFFPTVFSVSSSLTAHVLG